MSNPIQDPAEDCPERIPNPKRPKRNWLTRLLFGDIDHKYDVLIAALEDCTQETKSLRNELQEMIQKGNPLSRMVHNIREARQKAS